MIQSNDLCQECKYFDRFDHECNKEHYLEPDKFTIECEDYKKDKENNMSGGFCYLG